MKQARRISRNTAALLVSSAAKTAFTFAFVLIAARILGLSGFGGYELTVHYFELFVSLIATGVTILITRQIARDRAGVNQTLSAASILLVAMVILGGGVMQLLPLAFDYAPETDAAIRLIAVALLPAAFCRLLEAIFVAFEVAHVVTVGTVVEGILRVTAGIVLLLMGYGILALVLVIVASRTSMLVFYLFTVRKYVPQLSWTLHPPLVWEMFKEWKTFAAENWLSNVSSSAHIIILSATHGERALALYFAATKLGRLGLVFASSYTTAVFPHLSRLSKESAAALDRLSMDSIRFMLVIVLPVIITIWVFADGIIGLLYTAEYEGSAQILRLTIWIVLLIFINPFLSHVLFARDEQARSMQVAALRLTVLLVGSILLIPPFAGVGAAQATLLATGLSTLCYFYFVLRGRDAVTLLTPLGRSLLPSLALLVLLGALQESNLVLLLGLGGATYVGLCVLFGAVSRNDWNRLRGLG